jgi:hypothetical protein
MRLSRLSCNARWVEHTGRKPGLDDDDASRRQVITKSLEGPAHSIEGLEIADRTEKAQHCIVPIREVKIAHIGYEEPPCRMFLLRNADESGIEIYAIHGEALGSEKPGVLAGATCHVKNRLPMRVEPT